ncbi:MAG: hypothetical protein U0350_18400 [Caldilineaceae bacterium]
MVYVKHIGAPFILSCLVCIVLAACTTTSQFDKAYTAIAPGSLHGGQAIPAPKEPIILTVTGKIGAKNQGDQIVMDRPTLEAVGTAEYAISDPFENRQIVYRGILMRDLLKLWQVDKNAQTLHLVAINDYTIDVPVQEMQEYPVLFALQADGQYMQPNYHGPAMLIYPLDSYKLDPVATMKKLIWQIKTIDVQ